MGLDVKGRRCALDGRASGEGELDRLVDAFVDVCLGDGAGLDGGHELADRPEAGGGHLVGGAGGDARGVVVGAAPVGDDGAVKAPLVAEDVLEQMLVLVGIDAVHEVVGAHDGHRVGLASDDLKPGEVDLAQRALVEDGVGRLAAHLLAVYGKVLGAGPDTVALDAAHKGGSHLAGEVGVLGEVLEVAPAQRVALDAEARGEQRGHLLAHRLLAHGGANALLEPLVPGVGHGDGGGEAGCGLRPVKAEVVGSARLMADSGGPVGELDGGDAQALVRPAAKGGGTLEHRALLGERHPCD